MQPKDCGCYYRLICRVCFKLRVSEARPCLSQLSNYFNRDFAFGQRGGHEAQGQDEYNNQSFMATGFVETIKVFFNLGTVSLSFLSGSS